MSSPFQFIEYTQTPKRALNSQIENILPRKGLWLKRLNLSTFSELKSSLAKSLSAILYDYFDYLHWPELGDKGMEFQPGQRKEILFFEDYLFSKILQLESSLNLLPETKSNFVLSEINNNNSMNLGQQLEQLKELGFETLKIKVGKNFESELKTLQQYNLSHFEIRLDFNSALDFKTIKDSYLYFKKLPHIEYIEDPCPFDQNEWKDLSLLFPLAFDLPKSQLSPQEAFRAAQNVASHFIIKPSRNLDHLEIENLIKLQKKITLTNMMDSGLGAWKCYAYYTLLKKLFPKNICISGFYTHHLYQDGFASEVLAFKGANWQADLTKLDGFLYTLKAKDWKDL